jgi:uncharacterized protein (DUF305 family)
MGLRTIVVSVVAGVMVLASCGSDHDGHSAATVEVSPDAAFNAADVMFAQGMIPHHQQAIEMADMALDPEVGAGAAVVDLAARIKAGQDPEIAQMTTWLKDWGQPIATDTSDGHMMDGIDGMLSADEMKDLATRRGDEFDTSWMEGMIRHHEGAITMAEDVAANGKQPEVKALAEQIVAAQRAEIDEMRAQLGS